MRRRPPRSRLLRSTTLFRPLAVVDVGRRSGLRRDAYLEEHVGPVGVLAHRLERVGIPGYPDLSAFTCRDVPDSCLLGLQDLKSTRLNSSHANISYAVFCLKK